MITRSQLGRTRWRGLPLVVLVLGAVGGAAMRHPAPAPLLNVYVGVIGGSNARDVELSYKNVSTRDVTWSAAIGGAGFTRWSYATAWSGVDAKIATYGQPTAVWWPNGITTAPGEVTTIEAAWPKFLTAYALLRQRVFTAPLYMSTTHGNQVGCPIIQQALQDALVDKATLELDPATGQPYAIRSVPDIPPASHPLSGQCVHFNPILSTNVGQAAAQFLDQ